MVRDGYVYIMASNTRRLYTGVTNDLGRRAAEHREGRGSRFASRYRMNRLVYFEELGGIAEAIVREKKIKGLTRAKKIALIESLNPTWDDLYGKVRGMRPEDIELTDRLARRDHVTPPGSSS